jgi:hypothetical protein
VRAGVLEVAYYQAGPAGGPPVPDLEAGLWYFWYFLTERGRAGLIANRREIARVPSPRWLRSQRPSVLDLSGS